MKSFKIYVIITFLVLMVAVVNSNVSAEPLSQQPTISIPTVTGTPSGVLAKVSVFQEDQVNVRSGPGVFFDQVGVLLPGQTVPALGKSAGGDWVLIEYKGVPGNSGWVYSPFVDLSPGELPIVEPPPTPTPETTQTINPTLAAQFITTPISTALPTFTPGSQLSIPTYTDALTSGLSQRIPSGMIIIIIGGLGILIALISLITDR